MKDFNIIRRNNFCIIVIIVFIGLNSCRTKGKTQPIADTGSITINLSNEVDGMPIVFDALSYINAAGNRYRVKMLKYYISNVTLVGTDNSEMNLGNYKLIDAEDTATCNIKMPLVKNGKYKGIKFFVGIDSLHNHTGAQEGDLDPSFGMIWTWNTGYIFFKHEGAFIDDTGGLSTLHYHWGKDAVLSTVSLEIPEFEIRGNQHTIYLEFNLNKVYSAVDTVNFNNNAFHQSVGPEDEVWLLNLKHNMPYSFTFDRATHN